MVIKGKYEKQTNLPHKQAPVWWYLNIHLVLPIQSQPDRFYHSNNHEVRKYTIKKYLYNTNKNYTDTLYVLYLKPWTVALFMWKEATKRKITILLPSSVITGILETWATFHVQCVWLPFSLLPEARSSLNQEILHWWLRIYSCLDQQTTWFSH